MIGLYYMINNTYYYKNFLMKDKTKESEYNMMKEFESFVINLKNTTKKDNIKMYHWGDHEKLCNNIFEKKHSYLLFKNHNIMMFNLLNVFKNNTQNVGHICIFIL